MATKSIVYVGCRLPHGIILDHPLDASKKCTLQGLNKSTIIGATYKTNEVESDLGTYNLAKRFHYVMFNGELTVGLAVKF